MPRNVFREFARQSLLEDLTNSGVKVERPVLLNPGRMMIWVCIKHSSVLISAGSPGSPVQQAKIRMREDQRHSIKMKEILERELNLKKEVKTEPDNIDRKYLHQVADNPKMKRGAR